MATARERTGFPDPGHDRGRLAAAMPCVVRRRRSHSGSSAATPSARSIFSSASAFWRVARAERMAVGLDGPPQDEIVRFLAHVSLSFPASAIQRSVPGPPGSRT